MDDCKDKSKELLDGIRKQIDGRKLPKLVDLDGTQIRLEVKNGLLNWFVVETKDVACW
jgi:hypothetical protein